ncbi:ABC transporter permease [Nocardia sp. CA-290969]|uniref:ABC transporter permease n=1 Tax=Nocardia sp. CA-290969 TaxID=3239986 RepID=UPI003D94659F
MVTYLVRRLPSAVLVLFLASILVFAVLRLVPGSPEVTLAGADATPEQLAAVRADLGLDRPLAAQYLSWLGDLLTFDLGTSYLVGGSIAELISYGAQNTVVLTLAALLLAVVFALTVSTASVIFRSRILNAVVTVSNSLAAALPIFITGTLLVLLFGILWPILPSGGTPPDGFFTRPDLAVQYLLLPALTLAVPAGAALTRFLVEALHTELRQPYTATAQALGVSRRRIVLAHALPNALPSVLTVLGLTIGGLLGGAVLVESIFVWPGLGLLAEEAINSRDYPLVQVLLILSVAVFVVLQLLTDIAHAWLDPRIRLGGAA